MLTIPGASTSARHTTFVDETVVNGTETGDVGKEIGFNEMVTGNKINCDKSVRLIVVRLIENMASSIKTLLIDRIPRIC